jgi:UrcA family protein
MLAFHRINLRAAALLVMPALFAHSALAAPRVDEAPSEIVRYHDLNLNSPEGVAGLYRRIQGAASDVCHSVEGSAFVNRLFWTEWNDCVSHAVANAVKAVHNDNLSAYHWERIRGLKLPYMANELISRR